MSELTPDQARTLADGFLDASKAVGDFRFAHLAELSPENQASLRNLQKQLSDQSNHFTAVAIRLTLDDLQPTLDHIATVTKDVNDAVAKLDSVRNVITIATSFVALGTAIASGSPGGIAAAVQ